MRPPRLGGPAHRAAPRVSPRDSGIGEEVAKRKAMQLNLVPGSRLPEGYRALTGDAVRLRSYAWDVLRGGRWLDRFQTESSSVRTRLVGRLPCLAVCRLVSTLLGPALSTSCSRGQRLALPGLL